MKLEKAFKHALNMVMHAQLRSWLTILGIVIGVAAVVAIVSLGENLQNEMNSQFDQLGGDILTLRAGASRAFGFGPGRDGPGSGGGSAVEEGEAAAQEGNQDTLSGLYDMFKDNDYADEIEPMLESKHANKPLLKEFKRIGGSK